MNCLPHTEVCRNIFSSLVCLLYSTIGWGFKRKMSIESFISWDWDVYCLSHISFLLRVQYDVLVWKCLFWMWFCCPMTLSPSSYTAVPWNHSCGLVLVLSVCSVSSHPPPSLLLPPLFPSLCWYGDIPAYQSLQADPCFLWLQSPPGGKDTHRGMQWMKLKLHTNSDSVTHTQAQGEDSPCCLQHVNLCFQHINTRWEKNKNHPGFVLHGFTFDVHVQYSTLTSLWRLTCAPFSNSNCTHLTYPLHDAFISEVSPSCKDRCIIESMTNVTFNTPHTL